MKKFYLIFGLCAALVSSSVLPASPRDFQVTVSTVDPFSPEAIMQAALEQTRKSAAQAQVPAPALPSSSVTPAEKLPTSTSSWLRWPSLPSISLNPSRLAGATWHYAKKSLPYLAAGYILKRNFSDNVQRIGHSAHLTQQDNITALNLTITIRKNGWRNTTTFEINIDNNAEADVAGNAEFQRLLDGNLADEQKTAVHYAPVPANNVAALEQNETYRITIEGTVTYQNFGQYTLTKETTVETVQFGGQNQPANKQTWIQSFWQRAVAARIASVWQSLPLHLVPATGTTTYRAIFSYQGEVKGFAIRGVRFDLSNELCTVEAASLPELKEKIISTLADYILSGKPQLLQVQLSIVTPKDRFVSIPIQIALDTPHDEAFVIRVPAFPIHNLIGPLPVPFIHNPREQQRRAAALWQPNFEPVSGEVADLPQEPWTKTRIAKQIGGTIIFLFASWKLFPKLADGTQFFSKACGDFVTKACSTLSFQ